MFRFFVKNFSFPIFAFSEGMPGVMKHLHDLEESQSWPLDRIHNLQRVLLKRLLVHAYENTDFYRKRFDEAGFNPYTFTHADRLEGIPVLTKEQVRDNLAVLRAKNFRDDELHFSHTCEIAGPGVMFYRDNRCLAKKQAALYRFEKWPGWDIGERVGVVWPIPQDHSGYWTLRARMKNALYRREVVFPPTAVDEKICDEYVRELRTKRPAIIRGFPGPVCDLAGFMERKGVDDIPFKGVITTGERLYPHQRRLISQAFGCEVYDSYRSREAGPIAQECRMHEGLHINAESVYVEIGRSRSPSGKAVEAGDILVTDLLNYGQPFIRYRMNDTGRLSARKCTCGGGLPLLERLQGEKPGGCPDPEGQKVNPGSRALPQGCVN